MKMFAFENFNKNDTCFSEAQLRSFVYFYDQATEFVFKTEVF